MARPGRTNEQHSSQEGLTDHSRKPPSPILRLHRRRFVRRRNRSKIDPNTNERVDGRPKPLSKRSLRSQSHLRPYIKRLVGIFLLFRRTRLFPRTNRRISTLPTQTRLILPLDPALMLPLLGLFHSGSVFDGIFREISSANKPAKNRKMITTQSKEKERA